MTNHSLNMITLFGLKIANVRTEDALTAIFGAGGRIAFVNADCVNLMHGDQSYAAALKTADQRFPDGSGLSLAARLQGRRITVNLNGTDLFPHLCRRAALEGKSVFLLGGREGVAEAAAEAAKEIAPGLIVAGTRHGYFDESQSREIVAEINASGADILLVGLGAPRQDVWLERWAPLLLPRALLGVGGLFDYYSGRIPRAPKLMRRFGVEWIWRLMMEPRRLAKRYLLGNPLFVARALREAAGGGAVIKRAIDLAGAALGLVALAPLFLLVAAAIRCESRGPAFFMQTRVGKDGSHFRMIKFRSMYRDAEARRAALLAESERSGVCFKIKNDPRITRIGRLIRRASIDELPQLINVLKGEMSLVGPRPALPSEVEAYPPGANERHGVKPGITGLWQISGRAEVDFGKMIDLDIAYVRAASPLLDIVILLLTVRAVISARGAC